MNSYLLPRGAVAICLGWIAKDDALAGDITYFDSHILNSLDHVRSLYYPSYDRSEINYGGTVTLNALKLTRLVRAALRLQAAGFEIPVPFGVNSNVHDRAFTALVAITNGSALLSRVGDVPMDRNCPQHNKLLPFLQADLGLEELKGCNLPWASSAATIRKQFRLDKAVLPPRLRPRVVPTARDPSIDFRYHPRV